ncbi:MAG TPA: hypothetical protein VM690_08610 [Gaiellaceae bacterium]|nr:hypothetical protein [Gaiellaceae bacterium]
MLRRPVLVVLLGVVAVVPPGALAIDRSTIKLAGAPVDVAGGAGGVWVLTGDASGERLLRVDATTGRIRATIRLATQGSENGGVAVSPTGVWAAAGARVFRIDARRDRIIATISIGGVATSILATRDAVWVTRASGTFGQLIRIDPTSNDVASRTSMGGGPSAVVAAFGSIWVANTSPSSLMRIDPRTSRILATLLPGRFSSSLAVAQNQLWVAGERALVGLDGRGRIARRIQLGRTVVRIAAAGSLLWGIDNCACAIGRLVRIDLRRGRVAETITVGQTPVALAVADRAVWVANFGDASLSRVPYRPV